MAYRMSNLILTASGHVKTHFIHALGSQWGRYYDMNIVSALGPTSVMYFIKYDIKRIYLPTLFSHFFSENKESLKKLKIDFNFLKFLT